MALGSMIADAFQKYVDPNRQVGSQSERPEVKVENGVITVSGYQNFRIADGRVNLAALPRKYQVLHRYLKSNMGVLGSQASLLDIGCSAGLLCFIAKEVGLAKVSGLDHDREYVETVRTVAHESGLAVEPLAGDWKDAPGTYDIVCALALVHWIYSLTGNEGSFSRIFEYLYSKANRYLAIEWVDPKDPAIGHLRHVSANPEFHREPYELAHFEEAGLQFFGALDAKIDTTPTRCIYVFRKERRLFGHSAVVSFNDTSVMKHFRKDVMQFHPEVYERERKALATLDGVEGIPALLAADGKRLVLSHAGEPLSRANLPPDAEAQARVLVARMVQKGVLHNDIHYDNLLVANGRLHLIDFGWATQAGAGREFLPKEIGVNYRSRSKDEPVDDLSMFLRTIETVQAGLAR